MQILSELKIKKYGLFLALISLTLFFILVEVSFLIQCSGVYLGDFKLIANHLSIPLAIFPQVVAFIFIQLLLHLLFVCLIWAVTRLAATALHFSIQRTIYLGIGLWFAALLAILLANRIFFPNSKFSSVLFGFLTPGIAKVGLGILGLFLVAITLIALFGAAIQIKNIRSFRRPNVVIASGAERSEAIQAVGDGYVIVTSASICLSVIFLCLFWFLSSRHHPTLDAATAEKPNIVIIGMDSVRPDFLGFFGYAKRTPHIDGFLNHSTVFSDALTPLARTFPSWVSILTGIYPKLNTIRTNLADQNDLDLTETLPAILRAEGYATIFATDETRFSNIDQRYGFDQVITPPIGFNDFLLGTINDFPFANLIANTPVGKYLFPYTYANRSVYALYNPNTFLKLLQPTLAKSRTKPTLLITHLCLPHFPYAWESLPVNKVTLYHYQSALKRVDQQFHDLMMLLQQKQWLQHSIVILLSDHGEAVEIPGDRLTAADLFIPGEKNKKGVLPHFYPPSSTKEKINMSGGHGTDVLGLPQYHTVLAFRTFGTKPNAVRVVSGLVSVMDIKPTLLAFLDLPVGRSSGNPLQDYIFGSKNIVDINQDFFIESDFSPEAIRSIHPETRKVLFEGIDYFRIDPKTTRVVVRESMLKMILSSKQYADYYSNWVLALYPQNNKVMMPILVNLKTGEWTNDLTTEFAQSSPAHHMLIAMKIFFGSDITDVENS